MGFLVFEIDGLTPKYSPIRRGQSFEPVFRVSNLPERLLLIQLNVIPYDFKRGERFHHTRKRSVFPKPGAGGGIGHAGADRKKILFLKHLRDLPSAHTKKSMKLRPARTADQ